MNKLYLFRILIADFGLCTGQGCLLKGNLGILHPKGIYASKAIHVRKLMVDCAGSFFVVGNTAISKQLSSSAKTKLPLNQNSLLLTWHVDDPYGHQNQFNDDHCNQWIARMVTHRHGKEREAN